MFAPREPRHRWATEALRVRSRVITCEAVVSEAFFLLRASGNASSALRGLLVDQALEIVPLNAEMRSIMALMERYVSVPMSFADACLVRLSELIANAVVVTIDSDFRVYKKNGRRVIPVLSPD